MEQGNTMKAKSYVTICVLFLLLFMYSFTLAQEPPSPPPSHYVKPDIELIARQLSAEKRIHILTIHFTRVFNQPRISTIQSTFSGDYAPVSSISLIHDTNSNNSVDTDDALILQTTVNDTGYFTFSFSDTIAYDGYTYFLVAGTHTDHAHLSGVTLQLDSTAFCGDDTYYDFPGFTSEDIVVSVESHEMTAAPQDIQISQNYPNPFNRETRLRIYVPHQGDLELIIFNILGEKVATLIDRPLSRGWHHTDWDGTDRHGHQVSSGIYIALATMGTNRKIIKIHLLK